MSTPQSPRKSVSFKVSVLALLGDAQVGKTKLLTKYMQSKQFDTTYIETIGVNTMEKTIQLPSLTVHIHCLNMIHPNSSKLNKYLAYPYDCVMCLFFNSPLFFSLIFYSLYDKCCIDLFI
eukprot:605893_1